MSGEEKRAAGRGKGRRRRGSGGERRGGRRTVPRAGRSRERWEFGEVVLRVESLEVAGEEEKEEEGEAVDLEGLGGLRRRSSWFADGGVCMLCFLR